MPVTAVDAFKKTFWCVKSEEWLMWHDFRKDVAVRIGELSSTFYERILVLSFYNIMLSLIFQNFFMHKANGLMARTL